ncbi:Protein translocase subunit SecA [Gossypium arboreum]|uniref:Protein translocase subunit SecA n=1 Tax=Gossypium arboreum TaxID=29729 RepID=A0A0B0NSP9_GOSAR|nr:Protein translocase subunit SecA [Gossypium arboreum]
MGLNEKDRKGEGTKAGNFPFKGNAQTPIERVESCTGVRERRDPRFPLWRRFHNGVRAPSSRLRGSSKVNEAGAAILVQAIPGAVVFGRQAR